MSNRWTGGQGRVHGGLRKETGGEGTWGTVGAEEQRNKFAERRQGGREEGERRREGGRREGTREGGRKEGRKRRKKDHPRVHRHRQEGDR